MHDKGYISKDTKTLCVLQFITDFPGKNLDRANPERYHKIPIHSPTSGLDEHQAALMEKPLGKLTKPFGFSERRDDLHRLSRDRRRLI